MQDQRQVKPAIEVLGPIRVGGRPVKPAKQAALLGLLSVRFGRVVPADSLASELWPSVSDENARASLQVALSGLRKTLAGSGCELVGERPGYLLRGPEGSLDALVYRRDVDEALRLTKAGGFGEAGLLLERASSMWRGHPFGGEDLPTLSTEARSLLELHLAAEEAMALVDLEQGHNAAVIARAESLIEQAGSRESLWRILMLALYRAGRQADALSAFEDLRTALRDELGVDPSSGLQKLHRDILLQSPELERTANTFDSKVRGEGFFGRDRELEELRLLVERERLVTVAGVGGIGKTRLVMRLLQTYEMDHVLVELAHATDAASVTSAIAVAAGVRETPGSSLHDILAQRFTASGPMLVLDNCEHLLSGVREVLEILADARVLATSREPLGTSGERVWHIPPLELVDAVALFQDRSPNLSEPELAHVREICLILDGIPLALELAAARTRILSPAQIVERLEHHRLLEREQGPERHRALRAAIEWSVEALDEGSEVLFRRASVFRGPFTIDDIEEVCCFGELATDDAIPSTSKLVSMSLLTADRNGEKVSYRMLIPIRQVASSRCEASEEEHLMRRHFDRFTAMAKDPSRVRAAYDDIRAALEWSLGEGRATAEGAGLAVTLSGFWQTAGLLTEGRHWLSKTGGVDDLTLRASCLIALASLCLMQADVAEAQTILADAEALAGSVVDQQVLASLHLNLGTMAHMVGDAPGEKAHMQKAAEAADRAGDPSLKMRVANNMALFARRRGDLAAAEEGFHEALVCARTIGSEMGESATLLNLADIGRIKGDADEAKSFAEGALKIARRIGFTQGISGSLGTLGLIATEEGDHGTAAIYTKESLELARQLGDRNFEAASLANLGAISQAAGDLTGAELYLKDYLDVATEVGDVRHMSRASKSLADIRYAEGDFDGARRLVNDALTLGMTTDEKPLLIPPLALSAVLLADADPALASRIVAVVERTTLELGIQLEGSDQILIDKAAGLVGRTQAGDELDEVVGGVISSLS